MFAEIVTLTVMLGCIPCGIHSWQTRGKWPTIGFFGGGFIFGIVRENIVSLFPALYTYPNHPVYIGAAPLMMGFGWTVSIYASWCVAERLLEAFANGWKDNRWALSLVTGITAGALSIPVEVAAGAPETLWWVWPSDAVTILFEMPALVPFGWGGAAFLFVLFFTGIMKRPDTPQKNALLFTILTLVIIVIHLVYVLGVRLVIVILTGT